MGIRLKSFTSDGLVKRTGIDVDWEPFSSEDSFHISLLVLLSTYRPFPGWLFKHLYMRQFLFCYVNFHNFFCHTVNVKTKGASLLRDSEGLESLAKLTTLSFLSSVGK